MVPGQIYNTSLNDALHHANMGSIDRDPLTLYPEWQFVFYFGKSMGNIIGVQVAVWGDTGEIVNCNPYGFYGPGSQSTQSSQDSPANPIVILAIVSCAVALAAGLYMVKRKK